MQSHWYCPDDEHMAIAAIDPMTLQSEGGLSAPFSCLRACLLCSMCGKFSSKLQELSLCVCINLAVEKVISPSR